MRGPRRELDGPMIAIPDAFEERGERLRLGRNALGRRLAEIVTVDTDTGKRIVKIWRPLEGFRLEDSLAGRHIFFKEGDMGRISEPQSGAPRVVGQFGPAARGETSFSCDHRTLEVNFARPNNVACPAEGRKAWAAKE